MKKVFKPAFTMAEIIMAMTIIGVLAAITLPTLTTNIDARNFQTRRIALYSRLSQAVGAIGSLSDVGKYNADGTTIDNWQNTTSLTFILQKLSKGIQMQTTCKDSQLANCDIMTDANYYMKSNGAHFTIPATFKVINSQYDAIKPAGFTTKNGESVVLYYNPDCLSGKNMTSYKNMVCVNFMYDLNGRKSPNMVGKDVGFGSILYATNSEVVMPQVLNIGGNNDIIFTNHSDAVASCLLADLILPNLNEMVSIVLNIAYLDPVNNGNDFWTSSVYEGNLNEAWFVTRSTSSTPVGHAPISTTGKKPICVQKMVE